LHQYFCTKKLQSKTVTREKLRKAHGYKKFSRKMLMKLTQGQTKLVVTRDLRNKDQVSISSAFYTLVFVRKSVQRQTLSREKTFARKICAINVDEIDHSCYTESKA